MGRLRNLGHLDVKENEHVLGLTNNDYEGAIHILNQSPQCSICLKVLYGYSCTELPCNHIYHHGCLLQNFYGGIAAYNSCPDCRFTYEIN